MVFNPKKGTRFYPPRWIGGVGGREVVLGCWLQVAEGKPVPGGGPLRFAVKDLAAEKARLKYFRIGKMLF